MKYNKIKKIIEEIECYQNVDTCILVLTQEENKALLNYITTLEDYKSRCEKAIKFIDKYCIDDEFYINLTYKEKAIIECKNILLGDDNER